MKKLPNPIRLHKAIWIGLVLLSLKQKNFRLLFIDISSLIKQVNNIFIRSKRKHNLVFNFISFYMKLPEFYPIWYKKNYRYFETKFSFFLKSFLKNEKNPLIQKMSEYAIFPGRRTRPMLILGIAESANVNIKQDDLIKSCFAIELFHRAAIVLDDLLDEDINRRGIESFHSKYGIKNSILISHYLVSLGLDILSKSEKKILLISWAKNYREAVLGEFVDINIKKGFNYNKALNKTIAFFEFAGIILNEFDKKHNYIPLFNKLGKIFQISNDFFDFLELGKKNRKNNIILHDIASNFVVQYLKAKYPSLIKKIISKKSFSTKEVNNLIRLSAEINPFFDKKMTIQKRDIVNLSIPFKCQTKALDYVNFIISKEYWSHEYTK